MESKSLILQCEVEEDDRSWLKPTDNKIKMSLAHVLPNHQVGITLYLSVLDPSNPSKVLFYVGRHLDLLHISHQLREIVLQTGRDEAEDSSLLLFLLDSQGFLVAVSIPEPRTYLFEYGCPGFQRR